jgi:hypothetical protein
MIQEISQLWSGAKTRDGREISRAWTIDDVDSEGLLIQIDETFYVIPQWDKYRSIDSETASFETFDLASSYLLISD